MAREKLFLKMQISLKEHFLEENSKDTGFSNRILINTRATLLMGSITERENTHGAQAMFIKAITKKDKKVVMEFTKQLTDLDMRVIG